MPQTGGDIWIGNNRIEFLSLSGAVEPQRQLLEDISRRGMDGEAIRLLGLRGPPFELVGVRDCNSALAAEGYLEDLANGVGTMVQISDDHGIPHQDLVLLGVRADGPILRIATPSGGVEANSTALLRVRLTLQKVK